MSDITAQHKFACPSCGGEAQWNPAKDALVCPYCGTVSPAKLDAESGEITEHDLVVSLRSIDDSQRGWDVERVSVKCQSCQAVSVFDPSRVAQRCDFCGSSALIPFEQQKRPIRPESLLEFKLAETAVRDSVRAWFGSRWFAPNALKRRALTDIVHGIYIPYWTFDAQVHADWTAMAGDYYYETERYTDSNGRSGTRQVRKVRWYPSSGSLEHFFDDELVPASKGVQLDLLRKVEPFPTTSDLKAYNAGFLSGWVVEQYQIDLIAAAQHSQQQMDAKTRTLCAAQVPGDTHRDLEVAADYSRQTFKHVLVPVWLVSYTYGSRVFQVVVNGYTGAIAGKYPTSWVKVALLVIAIVLVLVMILGSRN
ncbi:MAG: zinc ribbon domain-containing protein [Chthoniobacteraceae bacterium]